MLDEVPLSWKLTCSFLKRVVLSANLDVWVENLPSKLDVVFQANLVRL